MRYEITIKKIEEKPVTKRGEWTIVDKRPWTKEELSKESATSYSETDFLKMNPLKEIRGYAPDWNGIEKSETEILKQTVDSLDLAAVIKAINGI